MDTDPLAAAGFRDDCDDCHAAVRHRREACAEHYVPTHLRTDPRECPTCGGTKERDAGACRRCRGADIT